MVKEKRKECKGVETRPLEELVSDPSKSNIESNGERRPSESESWPSYASSTKCFGGHVEVNHTSARTFAVSMQKVANKSVIE
jgi:hypothetical protein